MVPDVAMVLAAGFGSRMRHLTADRPKPMVVLDGRPMIDHVLDRLESAGVSRVVVNLHYRAAVLEHHLAGRASPQIEFCDERAGILDTGGGVKNALGLGLLGETPFIIHNSDSVWLEEQDTDNLARLLAAWDGDKMDSLLMLADRGTSLGYDGRGDFALLSDGRVRRRAGDESVPYVFNGVSIAHPRLFADSPDGAFSLNVLWDRALAAGRLYGIPHKGIWMHVGTPEALELAEAEIGRFTGKKAHGLV